MAAPSPSALLLSRWRSLSRLPGGRRLFSYIVGRTARYTGSISPLVEELRAGHARVSMRDRPRLRNHLRSVHAIALINLAEVTSGLALLAALPPEARGIPIRLEIDYLKKARGTITGECTTAASIPAERHERTLEAVLRDAGGEVVARAQAHWQIGPSAAPKESA